MYDHYRFCLSLWCVLVTCVLVSYYLIIQVLFFFELGVDAARTVLTELENIVALINKTGHT